MRRGCFDVGSYRSLFCELALPSVPGRDLTNANQYIAGLALCSLANIASAEICRDLSPEIESLLGNSNPYIRKKACVCAIRVLKKNPELVENYVDKV
jgi:AP-1 complex subunit gamma-1